MLPFLNADECFKESNAGQRILENVGQIGLRRLKFAVGRLFHRIELFFCRKRPAGTSGATAMFDVLGVARQEPVRDGFT